MHRQGGLHIPVVASSSRVGRMGGKHGNTAVGTWPMHRLEGVVRCTAGCVVDCSAPVGGQMAVVLHMIAGVMR